MGSAEVTTFLRHMAALLFLYRLPVVLTPGEVREVLARLEGDAALVAGITWTPA